MTPAKSIIPIVKLGPDNSILELLGTGFFVGPKPVIVTAKHVLSNASHKNGEKYGIVYLGEDESIKIGGINEYLFCQRFDIAALSGAGVPDALSLKICRTTMPLNQDVLNYEFSSTRFEKLSDGRTLIAFDPFTHKGNVMRHYISDFPESNPTPSFDTSFPALQGASGAPVLRASDFAVVGMLVSNHERHLLPAQVVRIDLGSEQYEETRYFFRPGELLKQG